MYPSEAAVNLGKDTAYSALFSLVYRLFFFFAWHAGVLGAEAMPSKQSSEF
jgi:hypothetical protein